MTTRDWFEKAGKEKFAIGAFNVDDFDIFKAVAEAAAEMKSPAMVEFSAGEIGYLGIKNCADLARNLSEEYKIPLLLNLDHSEDKYKIQDAIAAGFPYVHFDGGKLPYGEYLPAVSEIVEIAHRKDVLVEGEIDHITGGSEIQKVDLTDEQKKGAFTDPVKAAEFVEKSGVDTFASFIGNSHGLYASAKRLDLERLKKIKDALGNTFLSLHGSSGTDEGDLKAAIEIGIDKINLNTEIRATHRQALEKALKDNPDQVTGYKYGQPVIDAVKSLVKEKITLFGSANKL